MAFSVGSEERVNELTKVIKDAGYPLLNDHVLLEMAIMKV